MKSRRQKRVVAALVLAVLTVLGVAFLLGQQGTTTSTVTASADTVAEDPGYVALDAEIIQTTDAGEPLYTVRAARMEQRPSSGDISMEQIAMRYSAEPAAGSSDQPSPWTLQADHGAMRGGSPLVELSGGVRVAGKPPGSQSDARIATERLTFDTKSQDITTRAAVQFTWAGTSLRARGLRANLQQEHARLESAVHGRFTR